MFSFRNFLYMTALSVIFINAQSVFAFTLAQQPRVTSDFTRIFYYREGNNAHTSFVNHLDSIDVLAPQAYSINSVGGIKGSIDPEILAIAQKKGIKILPLITNGNFSQNSLKILTDVSMQDRAIDSLIKEAKLRGYWGWQFDFEQMDLSYRDSFSSFMKRFGVALKKEGLVSSVAVIAQVSEIPADYPKNLWQRIIGVYDYRALSSSTDFISVMSYDDPESKGPVARYSWMEKVIKHSLTFIPKEKLSLGIPLYYWKWDDARGKLVDIGGYSAIQNTLNTHKVIKGYSVKEQAPFIQYKVNKKTYTIWYENGKSISKKIDLITKYDLHGFSAWALGLETPDVHRIVSESVSPRSVLSYKNSAF